jgi:hypothetical protein
MTEHFSSRLPRLVGADGVTFGAHVFYAAADPPDWLRRHEAVHVTQYRQHGIVGFLARYVWYYVRGRLRGLSHWAAYKTIPFEVEAYAAGSP